jgi:hypothetical protein
MNYVGDFAMFAVFMACWYFVGWVADIGSERNWWL